MIAQAMAARARDPLAWSPNLILLGDFNIYNPGDVTMRQILDAGFQIPLELRNLAGTSVGATKRHYDQIAFLPGAERFEFSGRAGVLDYYRTVYRDSDRDLYAAEIGPSLLVNSRGEPRNESGKTTYYRTYWRTYQMSDHLPMWVELATDRSRAYLREGAAAIA